MFEDTGRSVALRVRALERLDRQGHAATARCAKAAAEHADAELRKSGVRILAKIDPESAVPVLEGLVRKASITERQNAMRTLGDLESNAADRALARWLAELEQGKVDGVVKLELLEASAKRKGETVVAKLRQLTESRRAAAAGDILALHDECLEGGQQAAGRKRFFKDDGAISCQRCHRIGDRGGAAGPDLTTVGDRLSREQLLASLLDPGREISAGFGTIVLTLKDDSVVAGVIKKETAGEVVLLDAEEKTVKVATKDIAERSDPVSSMPPMTGILKKSELRDLVEFLVHLKAK